MRRSRWISLLVQRVLITVAVFLAAMLVIYFTAINPSEWSFLFECAVLFIFWKLVGWATRRNKCDSEIYFSSEFKETFKGRQLRWRFLVCNGSEVLVTDVVNYLETFGRNSVNTSASILLGSVSNYYDSRFIWCTTKLYQQNIGKVFQLIFQLEGFPHTYSSIQQAAKSQD